MSATLQQEREHRTILAQKERWTAHAAANRGRIKNWAQSLWLDRGAKTGVLVAAGPSLEASLPELRALDRTTHEVVAVDMALGTLLAGGVAPDFVICADASEKIAATLEVPGVPATAALLLNVVVHPQTGARWPGPVFWFCMASNIFDGDVGDWMQRDHTIASKVPSYLVPGGNVGSLGLSFLLGMRAAPKVLLYGHDFCWTDDSRFYCGGSRPDLAAERIRLETEAGTVYAMKDAAGERAVRTNASLVAFARWFGQRMREYPGVIEQRTPLTILGPEGQTP